MEIVYGVGAVIVGVGFLFVLWRKVVYLLGRMGQFCADDEFLGKRGNTIYAFWLPLFSALLVGLSVGRIVWIWSNWSHMVQVKWSIFPFVREDSGNRIWFEFWPYRGLRIWEGMSVFASVLGGVVYFVFRWVWFILKARRRPCVQGRLRAEIVRVGIHTAAFLVLLSIVLISLIL